MKKRNKILALLLAMTMCGTALAGCGSDTKSSESTEAVSTETATSTETTATEPVAAEPLKNVDIYPLESDKTFTVATQSNLFSESNSTIITAAMEEATGVSIEWQYLTADQYKLALTGKEIPDATFLFGGLDKATVYEYGQADYFVNFMDYLDIMPNFAALIESNPEVLEVVQNEDGSERFKEAAVLLNYGFSVSNLYRDENDFVLENIPIKGALKQGAGIAFKEPFVYLDTQNRDISTIQKELQLPEVVEAPVKEGDVAGYAVYTLNGKEIGKTEIIYTESIEKAGFLDYFKQALTYMLF